MLTRRSTVLLAILAMLTAVLVVTRLARREETPAPAPEPPRVESPRPAPEKPEIKLDAELLIPRTAFDGVLSAADVPTSTSVIPIAVPYWGKEAEPVMLEPGPPERLADGIEGIFWFAWMRDGRRLIYSTRQRISVLDLSTGESSSIFSAYKIHRVIVSPDRKKLAAVVGKELFLLDTEGSARNRLKLRNWVTDAAWDPVSSRLAFCAGQSIYLVRLAGPASELTRHRYLKDQLSDPDVWRAVTYLDMVHWSPTGRYLSYRVHIPTWLEGDAPHLAVWDTRVGSRRVISEGYSDEDCVHSWSPTDDWLIVCGSYGEPDTSVLLCRPTNSDSLSVDCVGTCAAFQETSWRPGFSGFAVRVGQRYWCGGSRLGLMESKSNSSVYHLVPSAPPTVVVESIGLEKIATLSRRFAATPIARAESGIPDFDWSSDGSKYIFVDRFYTFRQWAPYHTDHELKGRPLALLRAQSGDTNQHIILGKDESPSTPKFSPDGRQVAYISSDDGTLWILPLEARERSDEEYRRWLDDGLAREKADDLSGAVSALRNAVRHSPGHVEPHRALSRIYERLARAEENPYWKFSLLKAAVFESESRGPEGRKNAERLDAHLAAISQSLFPPPPPKPVNRRYGTAGW